MCNPIFLSVIFIAAWAGGKKKPRYIANCNKKSYSGSNCVVICNGVDACEDLTFKVESNSVKNLIIRCTAPGDYLGCKGNINFDTPRGGVLIYMLCLSGGCDISEDYTKNIHYTYCAKSGTCKGGVKQKNVEKTETKNNVPVVMFNNGVVVGADASNNKVLGVVEDCKGDWKEWQPCSHPCGDSGTQQRNYKVDVPASPGGTACKFANGKTRVQNCNRGKPCQCTKPPVVPTNGKVAFSAGNNHGSAATFSCKAGFYLADPASERISCSAATKSERWPAATAKCAASNCVTGTQGVKALGQGLDPATNDACARAPNPDCCGRICLATQGCQAYAWQSSRRSCVTLSARPPQVAAGWVLCPRPTKAPACRAYADCSACTSARSAEGEWCAWVLGERPRCEAFVRGSGTLQSLIAPKGLRNATAFRGGRTCPVCFDMSNVTSVRECEQCSGSARAHCTWASCADPTHVYNRKNTRCCAPKPGHYFAGPECEQRECSQAAVGRYYRGSGGAGSDAQCETAECPTPPLGYYLTPGRALEPSKCPAKKCPRIANGYRFKNNGSCEPEECRKLTGYYYTGPQNITTLQCPVDECFTDLPAGERYAPGFNVDGRKCRTTSCPALGRKGAGRYYTKSGTQECQKALCTNAPTGYFYLWHGAPGKNACAHRSCRNAKLGFRYTDAWVAKTEDEAEPECPVEACPALPPVGHRYAARGSCDTTPCPAVVGRYYVQPGRLSETQQAQCVTASCANARADSYFIPGWNRNPDSCALKQCGSAPPPGFYYATNQKQDCAVQQCTRAPAGSYYSSASVSGLADNCGVRLCDATGHIGKRFIKGFATSASACPTKACAEASEGHFTPAPEHNGTWSMCQRRACPLLPGYWYSAPAEGGEASCAAVRSRCTNALRAERYVAPRQPVTAIRGCPVAACPKAAPTGYFFPTPGDCSTTRRCSKAAVGQQYSSDGGGKGDACTVTACASAVPGSYYYAHTDAGWSTVGHDCPAKLCSRFVGYTWRVPNDCTALTRCTTAPAGHYYSYGGDEVCRTKPCTATERFKWKFVKGFSLRSDACPKQACPGPHPPEGYAAPDRCDAASTTAAALSDEGLPHVHLGSVVGALLALAAIAVVVGVVLYWVRARKCGDKREAETVPTTGQSPTGQSNGGYCDPGSAQEPSNARAVALKALAGINFRNFVLNPDEVTIGRKLASGAGGQIFEGGFGDRKVALKESYASAMSNQNEEIIREAAMMTKLRHHNVVQFFGIWAPDEPDDIGTGGRVFLVMQLCPNGDLHAAARGTEYALEDRLKWIVQVASAMAYLHTRSPPVIHRDLKPQNVLLDEHNDARVCDFGLSKSQEQNRDMTTGVGTMAYMSPEMMTAFSDSKPDDTQPMDGTKCDVFSFAVLALFVATGVTPHDGLSNNDIFVWVALKGRRTSVPEGFANEEEFEFGQDESSEDDGYGALVALVQRMWTQQPEQRPAFEAIVAELADMFSL